MFPRQSRWKLPNLDTDPKDVRGCFWKGLLHSKAVLSCGTPGTISPRTTVDDTNPASHDIDHTSMILKVLVHKVRQSLLVQLPLA